MTHAESPIAPPLPTPSRISSRRRSVLLPEISHAPSIASCVLRFPENVYDQRALTASLERRWDDRPHALAHLRQFHANVGVEQRHLALPLKSYDSLDDFGAANDHYIRVATDLATKALVDAVAKARVSLLDIDALFFTTVTGVAAPSIDARVVNRCRLRPNVRRTPMFGLGCLGGAAGLSRATDYLRAYPDHVAVLLAVELCSLTLQDDLSVASMIASGLFADAAAAVVLVGGKALRTSMCSASAAAASARESGTRPRIVDTRSAFFYDTERVMGWDIGSAGFKVVLSADVPKIAREQLPPEVDAFLAKHRLSRTDIRHWICHPGGPKVIDAIERALTLPSAALTPTRESLAEVGNLSSASVLDVFARTTPRARPGDLGLLMAMGPGFCAELLLLEWQ